ncbi:putative conserved proline rich membrane protein [Mycobacterium tuberculosis]|nr:putative conserved proline rich membrane protein [Mycobacterium tuberculosis]
MVAPPAPVPANGEQFGPVTAPVPTAPGAPR